MKLVIVSATQKEVAPTLNYLEDNANVISSYRYRLDELHLDVLITGVGIPDTMYHLMKYLQHNETDHILNIGISGAFDQNVPLGKTYLVHKQRFADIGIQEADGSFKDIYDSELANPDTSPFQNGWLQLPDTIPQNFLPKAKSITVNKVLGQNDSIQEMVDKYQPDLSSMEGAAVAYICLKENIPYLEIRSVSNHVQARDKDKWDIPLAINQLNKTIISMVNSWKDISGDTPFPTE